MNPTQSNLVQGTFVLLANEDLTGKEGYLASIVNGAGDVLKAGLPAAVTAFAPYLISDGGPSGSEVSVTPIVQGEVYRIKLKGTCQPGDRLALADTGTAADKGKVRKQLTTTGTWRTLFLAEEKGADGQFVRARACLLEPVTVS